MSLVTGGKQFQFQVGIIVLCGHASTHLRRCLDSLMNQTLGLENMEFVLVDNDSADGASAIIQEYEEKHPKHILAVSLGQDVGAGAAKNIGLGYVSAEYVGFVDASDWVEPEMYQLLYEAAQQGQDDIVYCQIERAAGYREPSSLQIHVEAEQIALEDGDGKESFLFAERNNVLSVNKLYRKSFLDTNGIRFLEGNAFEDGFFGMLAFLYAGRVARLPRRLYHQSLGTDNTSLRGTEVTQWVQAQLALYQECVNRGFIGKYKDYLQYHLYEKMAAETVFYIKRNGQDPTGFIDELSGILGSLGISMGENKYYRMQAMGNQEKLYVDILIPTAERGGVENTIQRMIDALESPKFHFRVVQMIWEGYRWLRAGVPFYPLLEGRKGHNMQELIQSYGKFLLWQPDRKPDIILAAAWPYMCLVAKEASDALGIHARIVSWPHCQVEKYQEAHFGGWEQMAYADAFLAITEEIRQEIAAKFPNRPVYRVYNPTDLPTGQYPTPENDGLHHQLAYVGRLSKEKNLAFLLRAIAQRPNWSLHITGNGPERQPLEELAGELGLGSRVAWHGWQQEPWQNAGQMDAMALASWYEGFPLAAIEAQGRGLPVIAPDVGGLSELIENGVNGYLYQAEDLGGLLGILDVIEKQGFVVPDRSICLEKAKPYEKRRALEDMGQKLQEIAEMDVTNKVVIE